MNLIHYGLFKKSFSLNFSLFSFVVLGIEVETRRRVSAITSQVQRKHVTETL